MNDRKVKVAIIEPVGGHGGMDYYDFGLCEGLADSGVHVVLHTCDATEKNLTQAFEVRHSYRGIYGSDPSWKRGFRFAFGSFKAIVSSVLEGRKVCHFHFFHVGVLETFQVILAKICLRKVVITAHDVESFVESLSVPRLAQWVYRIADGVIAHNEVSKRELIDKLGVLPNKIHVIPHGNYLHMLRDMPSKESARLELNLNDDAPILLFFGQIKDVKGLDLLLGALPSVLQKHPTLTLLIAGRPWKSDFSKYEKIIHDLGVSESCVLHIRFIEDAEVSTFYAACDLVVLPYRRIYQSGVLLMSMSYGRVTLSSDLEGMTEVVTDGETGFLFQTESEESLTEKLIHVLDSPECLTEIERMALKLMQEKYDWKLIGEKMQRLYSEIEQ